MTCWFHLCIQLCSWGLGISSGRLPQFSENLELDLLNAWVKTLWCWYLQRKLLTLCFARVCLYCSLRPLMYGMTTLAPSVNFPVDGVGFLLVLYLGLPCWKNCVGWWLSCRTSWRWSISFSRNSGVEHTCLALWMKLCIKDSFAETGWLEL